MYNEEITEEIKMLYQKLFTAKEKQNRKYGNKKYMRHIETKLNICS